jgi:hypothetical protein
MFEFNFFPLGLEPLLLAVRGLILRCPTKVADRRMTIGRCRWQLPEIRSSCNNEEDFSLLAMNTEAIRQRHVTFASLKSPKDSKERLARHSPPLAEQPRRASADCLRIPAQVSHRPTDDPPVQQASSACRQWLDDPHFRPSLNGRRKRWQ